jgi:hypothetical protein
MDLRHVKGRYDDILAVLHRPTGEISTARTFVVYHSRVYPANFEEYTPEELVRWFRLYAANESIPKEPLDCEIIPSVTEWTLSWHDPLMQINKMYNNTALWHVWHNNNLIENLDFVGFSQYDMIIPRKSMHTFLGLTQFPHRVGYMFPHAWTDFKLDEILPMEFWQQLTKTLEVHDLTELTTQGRPAPLMHGIIMPRKAFELMMPWMDGVKSVIVRALGHEVRHLAGSLERAMALWIAVQVHKGTLGPACHLTGCEHLDPQRLHDAYRFTTHKDH